jgi:cobalt-zinc-cadmium efflux system outer membrane protein
MRNKIIGVLTFLILMPIISSPQEKRAFTLDQILNIGLSHNPWLLAKAQEVEAKKSAFQASRRLFNPSLELNIGKGKSHDSTVRRDTEGLSLSQPLENPFKRHFRIQMYENDWEASEHLFHFLRLETIYEIKMLFYKLLLLKNKEELAQKNLESLEETYQLIRKRVKLGETRELEAIKLYVETLKAKNELNKTRTEWELARENLNKSLGNVLPSDFSILGKLEYRPQPLEEQSLLSKALVSHPLIKGKEKDLEFAESQLKYVKWQRLPDFELSGFINEELHGKNKGIGVSLDIPLWNFKSKEIAQAESLLEKQSQELRALRMDVATEVKSRLNEQRLSEQTLALYHEGLLKQAEESLKISEQSYKQGEISLIDYLDSQRTYYSIIKDYQESLYAWITNRSALEKAIGEDIK